MAELEVKTSQIPGTMTIESIQETIESLIGFIQLEISQIKLRETPVA